MHIAKQKPLIGAGLLSALLTAGQMVPAQTSTPFSFQPEWRIRHDGSQANAPSIGSTSAPQEWLSRLRLGFAWHDSSGLSLFVQPQHRKSEQLVGSHWRVQSVAELYQGYVEKRYGPWSVRVGRQILAYGVHRLLDDDNWNNISRSFDAIRLRYERRGASTDLFVGRVGVADGKPIRPVLTGLYSTLTLGPQNTTDLYLLYVHDHEAGNNFGLWTVGTRPVVHLLGRIEASVETAFQFGSNGSKAVTAWAYGATLNTRFPGKAGLRLLLERDFASGGSPTDPHHTNTFDPLFGSSHAFFGSLIYVNWRNVRQWRVMLSGAPIRRWELSVDTHFLALADARDYWYAGGPVKGVNGLPLRSPNGTAGREIGTDVDLIATYHLSRTLSLEMGYSHFFPGHFIRTLAPTLAHEVNWFYLQPTWRF
ncbi:Alginate export [Chthonomonas calidirosea]|uniref:alginate export family protein n=1 Tax=Chthonomonas calidirosea TaxID=454171 RepID=UPI0006DD3D41|nr:alginate export family protein [Chthonomonas calidirosea]CEK16981.1 Alginate export [Chthonomonas calidirosea]